MKNTDIIQMVELSTKECEDIKAKGLILVVLWALAGYIADDWSDFKQGFADGFTLETN